MTTREEAISAAALILVQARAERDALSPHAAAVAAWYPGHELVTVEAIEELIIRQRQEAIARAEAAKSGCVSQDRLAA